MENSPSPSPPPPLPQRLRRSPKRQALAERTSAHTNEANYSPTAYDNSNDDLFHTSTTIRTIAHDNNDADLFDAKFLSSNADAPSPAPLRLPSRQLVFPAPEQGSTQSSADPVKPLHPPVTRDPSFPHPGPSSTVSRSNTPGASSPAQSDLPINAQHSALPSTPLPARHGWSTSTTPPTTSPDLPDPPSSSPPWIALVHSDQSSSSPSHSLDAERRAMEWRDSESDGDTSDEGDLPLHAQPTFFISTSDQDLSGRRAPTPREMHQTHQQQHDRLPQMLLSTPASSQRPGQTGLGAIASAVSSAAASSLPNLLTSEATPVTISSIGSAGTVRRNQRYTGNVPAGFYSLFPPVSSPRSTPASRRMVRSSSDLMRPVSMGNVSPPSSGGSPQSPRSPISPMPPLSAYSPTTPTSPRTRDDQEHWGQRRSFYMDESRSRSEAALNLEAGDVRILVNQPASPPRESLRPASSLFSQLVTQSNQYGVPRRPVPRQSSGRWQSAMSVIQSEPSDEMSSSGHAEGAYVRASRASSIGVEVARLSERFPIPQSPVQSPVQMPISRYQPQRPAAAHHRHGSAGRDSRISADAYDKELPSIPGRSSPRRPSASTATSATPSPRRDRHASQPPTRPTGHRKNGSGNSVAHFRESIQPWARSYYSDEAGNRRILRPRPESQASDPRYALYGTAQVRPDSLRVSPQRQAALLATYQALERSSPGGAPRRPAQATFSPLSSNPVDRYSAGEGPSGTQDHRYSVQDLARHSRPPAPRPNLTHGDWSPHLWHDRRTTMLRRRTFIAPSIDESAEGRGPTKRNLQVWLFALGFVFPLSWIFAALMPLPAKPRDLPPNPGFERDIEKALGPTDMARYENARWWRNVNRAMTPVALALIAAVVVLVVVAAKQRG